MSLATRIHSAARRNSRSVGAVEKELIPGIILLRQILEYLSSFELSSYLCTLSAAFSPGAQPLRRVFVEQKLLQTVARQLLGRLYILRRHELQESFHQWPHIGGDAHSTIGLARLPGHYQFQIVAKILNNRFAENLRQVAVPALYCKRRVRQQCLSSRLDLRFVPQHCV